MFIVCFQIMYTYIYALLKEHWWTLVSSWLVELEKVGQLENVFKGES